MTATIAPASPAAPDPDTLEEAAKLLGRAEKPLIITSNAGRTAENVRALRLLAETFAIPVVQYRPRYLSLATEHPLAAGWDPHAALKEADLVIAIECDVPWIPVQGAPRPEAKVIHIGADPLFARYPMRGFRTDIALAGALAPTLAALCERTQKHAASPAKIEDRRKEVVLKNKTIREKARGGIDQPASITGKWASACLNRAMGEDAILVNEYPIFLEEMTIAEPMRYFGTPPSGGLGWGLGAALGAKLAAPDRTVIAALGDGAYMFGNPTPGHFVGESMRLPVLYVVFNNARWAAVHRATLASYPGGFASKENQPPFATLEPSPRFEHVVQASGGHGERVTEPGELMPALERALRVVREEKRQALLNVCLEASYVKTS
jgi:acetolactate synthase-1/2/3 large subunit